MSIDKVQKCIVEVDSQKLLSEYLRLAMTTALQSHEELAVKVLDRSVEHFSLHLPPALYDQDKHFPVIFIGGWFLPRAGEENSYFHGYGPWETFQFNGTEAADQVVRRVQELLAEQGETWESQFQTKFGDGYNGWFGHGDGSVGIGYELRSCGCFPERLAISLVHMYYGK